MFTKLYVGNLSLETKEEALRTLFEQAGTVESARIITDRYSGSSKGFGFVEIATSEEAYNSFCLDLPWKIRKRVRGTRGQPQG